MQIEENEIKKIYDKLKEHYKISYGSIKIDNANYDQIISIDGKDIGGINIKNKDKTEIITDLNNNIDEVYIDSIKIKTEERRKNHARSALAILFYKIRKIKYGGLDKSKDFWEKIDPDYDHCSDNDNELTREKFFNYNFTSIAIGPNGQIYYFIFGQYTTQFKKIKKYDDDILELRLR